MMNREKTKKEVYTFVEMTSDHQGWILPKDDEFLDDLVEGLKSNWNRFGYFHCPCRAATGDRKKDEDVICPCLDYCLPDIEEYGQCYCGLYLNKDFYKEHKKPVQIPERRPEELDPFS